MKQPLKFIGDIIRSNTGVSQKGIAVFFALSDNWQVPADVVAIPENNVSIYNQIIHFGRKSSTNVHRLLRKLKIQTKRKTGIKQRLKCCIFRITLFIFVKRKTLKNGKGRENKCNQR